jgi:hypothetical protein
VATPPRIELLWWEGCPSWPRALDELRAVVGEAGLDPDSIERVHVGSDADAERLGFVGSPTIRIDGEDIEPPSDGDVVGLACRLYRLRDGLASPTPDPADVRDALREALSRRSASR